MDVCGKEGGRKEGDCMSVREREGGRTVMNVWLCVCVVRKKGIAKFEKPAMQPKGAVIIYTFV